MNTLGPVQVAKVSDAVHLRRCSTDTDDASVQMNENSGPLTDKVLVCRYTVKNQPVIIAEC